MLASRGPGLRRPEEGGGFNLSTGHACQQRPLPSAPDIRAGKDSPLAFRRKVGLLECRACLPAGAPAFAAQKREADST